MLDSAHIKTKNYQNLTEEASSLLRELIITAESKELAKDFISKFTNNVLWVCKKEHSLDKSIYNWYQSTEYRKKYNRSRRLVKYWENEEPLWSPIKIEVFPSNGNAQIPTVDKKSLLQKIVTLTDELSQNFDMHKEAVYLYYKSQLYAILTEEEIKILEGKIENIQSPSELYIFKKFLHSILLHLRRLSLQGIRRDLRQFLRNIVHFRFKNMSDESDTNNFLFKLGRNKKLLENSNLIYDEHKTDYRAFGKYC